MSEFAIIRTPSQRQRLGNIRINAVLSEVHSRTNTITRASIEGEEDRSQHIVHDPIRVTLRGVILPISDSFADQNTIRYVPLADLGGGVDALPTADGDLDDNEARLPPEFDTLDAAGDATRQLVRTSLNGRFVPAGKVGFSNYQAWATAWARMNALFDSDEPFEYVSDLRLYQDMVFESLEMEVDSSQARVFTATLVEFRYSGVTRDRWLSADQSDKSRDPANIGSTPVSGIEESIENLGFVPAI